MSYLKDREIWLSKVPTGNPPTGFFWKFIQDGVTVIRDSEGNDKKMVSTTGDQTISGSLTITGDIVGTASTASYVDYSGIANLPTLVSGSEQIVEYGVFATTGSNQFDGSQIVTGSLTVTGDIVAQTLNVQQVTSSVVYSSGSNVFGNSLTNTHEFTGSLSVTGSLLVNGNPTIVGTGTRTADYIPKFGSDTNQIQNSQIFDNGTFVGINTSSDIGGGAKLQVNGNATFSGNVGVGASSLNISGYAGRTLTVGNGTQSENAVEIYSNTTTNETLGDLVWLNASSTDADKRTAIIRANRIGANNSSSLSFFTKNAGTFGEHLTITSGGNVLINSTSDNGARLQVNGQGTFTDSQNGFNLNLTKTDGFGATIQLKNTSALSNDLIRILDSSNNIISRIFPVSGGISIASDVLINTTGLTGGGRLQVSGDVNIQGTNNIGEIGLKSNSIYNSIIRDYIVETSSFLDITTERTDGGGFNFILAVSSTLIASASNRNYYLFSVSGRGTTASATQLSNVNAGDPSRTAINVSFPSNGVMRLNLTGGELCQIKVTAIGHNSL